MDLPPLAVDEKLPILKKTRLSTGVKDLDIILEGGYSNPSNIMLLGPTGREKAVLAFQFAAAGKKTKESTCIICSDSTPADVLEKARAAGIELKAEDVMFIDCYSSTLGGKKPPESTDRITIVPGPGALNDLSLALNDVIKKSAGKKLRVLFFSLSTFVLYAPKESITKFVTVIGGRLKNVDATTIFVVEEGIHDKQLISLLEHSMDGKFQITEQEGRTELEVPMLNISIPIKLTSDGIVVL